MVVSGCEKRFVDCCNTLSLTNETSRELGGKVKDVFHSSESVINNHQPPCLSLSAGKF